MKTILIKFYDVAARDSILDVAFEQDINYFMSENDLIVIMDIDFDSKEFEKLEYEIKRIIAVKIYDIDSETGKLIDITECF